MWEVSTVFVAEVGLPVINVMHTRATTVVASRCSALVKMKWYCGALRRVTQLAHVGLSRSFTAAVVRKFCIHQSLVSAAVHTSRRGRQQPAKSSRRDRWVEF